jgi:hypothetical protein
MQPTIRLAESAADRARVFRFRYRIYVEEMGRTQKHADHARRTIEEPFDATAHLLLAEAAGEIVGTLRANFARETDLGYYPELFGMTTVARAFPDAVSLTTKLMICPAHRSGTLAVRLALAMYEHGTSRGIRHDFIDCNAHLEDFFTRLGYRRFWPYVEHPEYGRVLPLRLDLDDFEHLRALGSPLARNRRWREPAAVAPQRLAA